MNPLACNWELLLPLLLACHSKHLFCPFYYQRYMITFYDDYTFYTWVSMLTSKDKAIQATRHFLSLIENQYHASVKLWMTDIGEEYKSIAFDQNLKDRGICILQSTPYTPQQNSCMECLMCMLLDKAECMCHKLHSVISPSNLRRFPRSQSQLKALKKTFRSMPVTSRGDQYWLRY